MMKKLNELFDVNYGNKFDLNKMKLTSIARGGISFVGRSSQNHGVSAVVERMVGVTPFAEGLITVALGGSKLLSAFVQERPFYTAQNVAVLKPLLEMSFAEKLFYCLAIRHNRFKYSAFGREANRTLRYLIVPEPQEFPEWVRNQAPDTIELFERPSSPLKKLLTDSISWGTFEYADLFEIKKGRRLTKENMKPGFTPFIGATDSRNGITTYVGQEAIHRGNTITVTYNGSVAEAFFQPVPFWASDDVNVLYPKFELTPETALFITTIIRKEKYRFNYGRKWHLVRMKKSKIRLPVASNGTPDWNFMTEFIKSLPFSTQIS